jgi:glycine cleavage system H protein
MPDFPSDLRYTKDHEWAKAAGMVATVGITAFACEQLGDVVYVELPKKGDKVKAGVAFGVVESTKATSDVFSPVSGTVQEVNSALADAPETINEDPYGKGWLVKIAFTDPKEMDALMDSAKYSAHVAASKH